MSFATFTLILYDEVLFQMIELTFSCFSIATKTGHEKEGECEAAACTPAADERQSDLKRADFLLKEAMSQDEQDNRDQAVQLYMEAVELCLKAKESSTNDQVKQQLTLLADQALTRAELLKGITKGHHQVSSGKDTDGTESTGQMMSKLSLDRHKAASAPSSSSSSAPSNAPENRTSKGLIILGPNSYSKEEIAVLRRTSIINGREYVPFLSVDLNERFALALPFTDKSGFLALSNKVSS